MENSLPEKGMNLLMGENVQYSFFGGQRAYQVLTALFFQFAALHGCFGIYITWTLRLYVMVY